MSSRAIKAFFELYSAGHSPERMDISGSAGDINRLSSRVRLAKAFRGICLEGYSESTTLGYNAFFQVFLTHSALERYLALIDTKVEDMEAVLSPYGPEEVVREFFRLDSNGRLFDFLHARVKQRLKGHLTACRDGTSSNVGTISASIRHIFAHGHLTANANDQDPRRCYRACGMVSEFLLAFIDEHFSQKIDQYRRGEGLGPSGSVDPLPDRGPPTVYPTTPPD